MGKGMVCMNKIRKGDIVTRISYGNDILFWVKEIIKSKTMAPIAILKGVTLRIEASAPIEDLKLVNRKIIDKQIDEFERSIETKANKMVEKYYKKNTTRRIFLNNNRNKGLILHLDGDKNYSQKSAKVYEKFKLNAIVKNIKESKQPFEIVNLLNKYNPDIVVITGHDGMIKKGYRYNDIYNYRNSKYFVRTVQEARRWEQGENRLAIFAGACQSYYEALIEAGANFASSPARILIDFMDPLIIAETIATTPERRYITIEDIRENLRDGERGVGGLGSYGKLRDY